MTNPTIEAVEELKGFWSLLFPDVQPPADSQWALWLLRHDHAVVRRGLVELATRYKRLARDMTQLHMAKFASAVMNQHSHIGDNHASN